MPSYIPEAKFPPGYAESDTSSMDTKTALGEEPPTGYTDDMSPNKGMGLTTKGVDLPRGTCYGGWLYYRVYGFDGPISPKGAFGMDNPFIGRIKATAVPPPHTVASLKRALTKDARTPMAGETRVEVLTGEIGATPQTPLALVLVAELPNVTVHVSDLDDNDRCQWLYYRLYSQVSEAASARSFDSAEPSLGRIDRELIPPPRNVSSVKRRIAKLEGKRIYEFAELFTDVAADRAQASQAFIADTYGASKEDPIVLVQPERRAGVHNRPLLVVSAPPSSYYAPPFRTQDGIRGWLSPSPGDIVHTDGIRLNANYKGLTTPAFTAVDRQGRTGWVWAGKSEHHPF
ncbi:hypothetical protein DFH07DRAFT_173728 [Mycena maculata]|uniref:Uncharacterized protein n=1 Tax=Mycena maculata TaxID=230809 RepID=A0AAD7HX60_9AGAR|nr:hypothetical protein DFH07DRAFT_173728 [Mycena maculata]